LISESVREAIENASDIELGTPREVELKGIRGTHELYPVAFSAPLASDTTNEDPALTS
ncbi:MAG: adenylate cyclase, partial [Mycobacterium sp.]|nr:adenylate cyclase [Mycobacterium sp.]